jgi:hypothetical protein
MQLSSMEVLALITAHVQGHVSNYVDEDRLIALASEFKVAREREHAAKPAA